MTKAKYTHKENYKYDYYSAVCGQTTYNTVCVWATVTCPKCLAKKRKPKKQSETNLFIVLDGSVSVVEKKENGEVVSQEKIDSLLILQCLNDMLERGVKAQVLWEQMKKETSDEENRAE